MKQGGESEFPKTSFSLLHQIQRGCNVTREQALEKFIESYRPALVAFLVRRMQINLSTAEDLVHDFLITKIMNGKILGLANEKGRFRNVLRVCLRHYLIDSIRKEAREPISKARAIRELDSAPAAPEEPLDQVWAIAIFRNALNRMQQESDYWGLFCDRVLTQPPLPYADILQEHGFANPQTASNCLITAKRQFNLIMRDTLSEQSTLTDGFTEDEMRIELEYLRQQLADSRLVNLVVDSLPPLKQSAKVTSRRHSYLESHEGEIQPVLISESADADWDPSETEFFLLQLLDQSPQDLFINCGVPTKSLRQLLDAEQSASPAKLQAIAHVKDFFNKRAKETPSEFPTRVCVTMTLVAIASYLINGGQLKQVTSMTSDKLVPRLQQIAEKDWLPSLCTKLISQALSDLEVQAGG